MRNLILRGDLGTTSIKQALIDENGRFVAKSMREYTLSTPDVYRVECGADTYWQAFASGLRELLSTDGIESGSIRALGISAQGETLFFLDRHGEPLRDAIVWMDNRAGEEAEALRRNFGDEMCYQKNGTGAV